VLDLFSELLRVTARLDAAGIRYALVGGLAYSVWVETRATEDIDLLLDPQGWPEIAGQLEDLGYRNLAKEMNFREIRIRRLTKMEAGDVLILDLLLADPPFSEALDSAVEIQYAGGSLRVARPETIIELKKLRMSPRDQSDIAGLERLIDEQT
jgi:hypothetical protein